MAPLRKLHSHLLLVDTGIGQTIPSICKHVVVSHQNEMKQFSSELVTREITKLC